MLTLAANAVKLLKTSTVTKCMNKNNIKSLTLACNCREVGAPLVVFAIIMLIMFMRVLRLTKGVVSEGLERREWLVGGRQKRLCCRGRRGCYEVVDDSGDVRPNNVQGFEFEECRRG